MTNTKPIDPGVPVAGGALALEKIASAAQRMGLGSVSTFYRTAKRDNIRIVKTGLRASAVVRADIDRWIALRIAGDVSPMSDDA